MHYCDNQYRLPDFFIQTYLINLTNTHYNQDTIYTKINTHTHTHKLYKYTYQECHPY